VQIPSNNRYTESSWPNFWKRELSPRKFRSTGEIFLSHHWFRPSLKKDYQFLHKNFSYYDIHSRLLLVFVHSGAAKYLASVAGASMGTQPTALNHQQGITFVKADSPPDDGDGTYDAWLTATSSKKSKLLVKPSSFAGVHVIKEGGKFMKFQLQQYLADGDSSHDPKSYVGTPTSQNQPWSVIPSSNTWSSWYPRKVSTKIRLQWQPYQRASHPRMIQLLDWTSSSRIPTPPTEQQQCQLVSQ